MEVEAAAHGDEKSKPQPFSREALERELNAGPGRGGDAPARAAAGGRGRGVGQDARHHLPAGAPGRDGRRSAPHPGGDVHQQGGGRAARAGRQAAVGADGRSARAGCGSARSTPSARASCASAASRSGCARTSSSTTTTIRSGCSARVLTDLKVPERMFPVRQVLSAIDRAKNQGIGPADFVSRTTTSTTSSRKAYRLYEERLAAANATDFGDLLLPVLRLCAGGTPAARGAGASASITCWSTSSRTRTACSTGWCGCCRAARSSITVVGDEDQSIYRWRGADIRNILDFERDHPGARVVKLERNYRSTGNILARRQRDHREEQRAAAQAPVHGGGRRRAHRRCSRARPSATRPSSSPARIEDALSATLAPRDFAVFYRTNAQSRVLEDALRARNCPYAVVGGTRFFDRAEIKDLVCYLRAVANPDDGLALQRIINVPARGIGGSDRRSHRRASSTSARSAAPWEALELVGACDDQESCWAPARARRSPPSSQLMTKLRAEGGGLGPAVAGREDPGGDRLPRRAGRRGDDGGRGARSRT